MYDLGATQLLAGGPRHPLGMPQAFYAESFSFLHGKKISLLSGVETGDYEQLASEPAIQVGLHAP